MLNAFSGIEMGKRALNAYRLGMQTVGHNVSNMRTEGYSRQRVLCSTVQPMDLPGVGQVGQGMKADEIVRIRDQFLDFQYRSNLATKGYWDTINAVYQNLQNYIPEPKNKGLSAAMDTFYAAMRTLQQKPEDAAARRSLVESARSIGGVLDTIVTGFETYAKNLNQQVLTAVQDANQMLHKIAALNKQIYKAEALDQNANDLMDQRDLLLDKLSEMLDVTTQEPLRYGEVNGEFFLTLNGRALIQGDHVRELRAHAFQWDGQVYYDVQVAENEFDIVENCYVADILATGPEGVHQLTVDRLANGKEWALGGGDPLCLDTRAVTTSRFKDGVMLDDASDKARTRSINIRTTKTDGTPVSFTVDIAWDAANSKWTLKATDSDGAALGASSDSGDAELTVKELGDFLNGVIAASPDLSASGLKVVLLPDGVMPPTSLRIEAGNDADGWTRSLEVRDVGGTLGMLSPVQVVKKGNTRMRSRPMSPTEALGIKGSFRIQVGTQGTRVTSGIFRANAAEGLKEGEIIGPGKPGDRHTFRIGVADDQVDVTASWNDSSKVWELTSDVFASGAETNRPTPSPYPVVSASGALTVAELTDFMNQALPSAGISGLSVVSGPAGGTATQFYVESKDHRLISISDVEGSLAKRMGIVNKAPVVTIDVEETDTLTTIRNKINEKYQAELGLTAPEDWVHASLKQDVDQSWYLTIASDVPGEAQRITLMGGADGNDQVLRRLGLMRLEQIGTVSAADKTPVYREVAAISTVAEDASFTFNGVRYLSADNRFKEARRIPASGGSSDYSASKLVQVEEGMWFNLKHAGSTAITVRHHVRNGTIKALEEARDGIIPNLQAQLNELTWGLVNHVNAYQYSGYGIGGDITTTGVAFFKPLSTRTKAASNLSVNDAVVADNALIGAAMGRKNAAGIAVSGVSGGSGDGSNALRMADLASARALKGGTMTIRGVFDAMLSQVGSEAAHAQLMSTAQDSLAEQIGLQREAVSGVNLDEELMDMITLNRCFGAMSRYVTTLDEMLNAIINGFGLVGR